MKINMSFNIFNNKYLRFILFNKDKRRNKGFAIGTPIVVFDVKRNKNIEFISISEAARYFNTYPKTIWRIVYGNKLYLDRYQMMVIDNKYNWNGNNLYVRFFKCIYYGIKDNKALISYTLLAIILGAIFYMITYYLILMYKEIYNEYIFNIRSIKANHVRYMFEHSFTTKNNLINNYKSNISISKINRFLEVNREWKFDAKIGIYQIILKEINLDFSSKDAFLAINSVYSSPIIERIDLNNVFYTITTNTTFVSEPIISNSLGINSNRNSLTLNTSIDALTNRRRSMELLNYQSNILYLLINKLSPSIY